jgi:hypothetical protein
MSMGGVFLRTATPKPVDTIVNLHFLVQEGQVRADAIVRHIEPGQGLGLKFTALNDEDRPHLAALLYRLRAGIAGASKARAASA